MANGRKTGGRKKGVPNKRTLERQQALQEAVKVAAEATGTTMFDGDAHALLALIYRNEALPIDLRADAAKSAIRFEKPALASTDNRNTDTTTYLVALPSGETMTREEWKAKYAPAPVEANKATEH
jgi:hypothetical protein